MRDVKGETRRIARMELGLMSETSPTRMLEMIREIQEIEERLKIYQKSSASGKKGKK